MAAQTGYSKRPSWAQSHHTKPKRVDRRARRQIRALKAAG